MTGSDLDDKVAGALSERDLDVIINALNYAKDEWASCDDEHLSTLSDDADALEKRLHGETEARKSRALAEDTFARIEKSNAAQGAFAKR